MNLKRGDSAPVFRATLYHAHPSRPIDLHGATVNLVMMGPEGVIYDGPALIIDEEKGVIGVDWNMLAPETDVAGPVKVEAEITFPSGRRQTVPASGYETIHIHPKLRPWPVPTP